MAIANPEVNGPTSTGPVEVFRAALHRAEQPVWWLHVAFATLGYAVLLTGWFVQDRRRAVTEWLDSTDDVVVARFPFLVGQKRGQK